MLSGRSGCAPSVMSTPAPALAYTSFRSSTPRAAAYSTPALRLRETSFAATRLVAPDEREMPHSPPPRTPLYSTAVLDPSHTRTPALPAPTISFERTQPRAPAEHSTPAAAGASRSALPTTSGAVPRPEIAI
ncbi:hypothetical protein EMIHUDRAFT_213131 [Emiliania huxleyi CCMP1516]|uniref:Uncharacterized protein n=2 Tax=Emiliania huxleyi TaxID=2903 RepID=A0A0D3INQ9_EMIH1|nr:hypothetical protein EMIHUDRAFT_213131 [Emiliania huxleyi CCMP1516]EOD12894.1 hypothetical protein EMIHUDRAFT_213131 [Emiliania huxleyi CCMP1516]|eukprot:XP_005765323.1 hypothetical protein EMIHUDRAFT_213131 [Emiliania huxleyi CCMP1516]